MLRRAFFSALSLFAAACSDNESNGPTSLSGSASFTYSGGVSGSFTATGAVPTSGLETSAWAAGERDATNQVLTVEAFMPRNSSTHDVLFISANRLSVGTSTITSSCSSNVCTVVSLTYAASNTTSGYDTACFLTTGSVTISSISNSRASGTFSGTGTCIPLSGGANSSFTITGGTFDVALISSVP